MAGRERAQRRAGITISPALEQAIRKCRSYILLLTPRSLRSDWGQLEWEAAAQQSAEYAGFKTVLLVSSDLDPDDLPSSLRGKTLIQLSGSDLDGSTGAKLLASLRPDAAQDQTEQDVFVTRTWRDDECASAFVDVACGRLVRAGYRLIGDEPRSDDDPNLLHAIISSCAAYIALIPPRTPSDLRWLLQDVAVAKACAVPMVILANPLVLEHKADLRTPKDESVTLDNATDVLAADMTSGVPDTQGKRSLTEAIERIENIRKRLRNS